MRASSSLRAPALVALAVLALAGTAAAQTYQISQGGKALGTFDLALTRDASGATSLSSLHLTGLADLSDRLQVGSDGHALSYRLEGTARGAPVTIEAAIQAHNAALTIQQAGHSRSLDVPLPGPVVVLDNSMLDGWQLLLDRLGPKPAGESTVDVLVPQAAATGTVTLSPEGEEDVDLGGGQSRPAERIGATMKVAGQVVKLTLWRGQDGTLLAFGQPSVGLRYQLETPASAASAAAQAASQAAAVSQLEQTLARQKQCVSERDGSVTSAGATLAGSLTVPKSARPAPALLLLPGSGAVDRNGNVPPLLTNGVYRQLAYALGCQGFAVLRIDKLGIGASTGDGNAVTLQTYAQNVHDWMAWLRRQPGVDGTRVALMGHSEGGLIALYSVAEGYADPTAVVLLESPGMPLDAVILDQVTYQDRLKGASPQDIATTRTQLEAAIAAIKHSSGVSMELTGELASNPWAATFAHAAGLLRSEFAQDPAALASRVSAPVLVVQGGKDVQVTEANGRALAKAASHATYLFLPDLAHDLYQVRGSAIDHSLPDAGTPLSPVLIQALHTWLLGYLTASG